MKVKIALAVGALMLLPVSSFGKCRYRVEAEAKKNILPVKYAKLVKENKQLQSKLDECKSRKVADETEVNDLTAKISSLETSKANLQAKLNAMPSASELQSETQKLEQELGR